jgi:hypothetical protein
MPIIEGARENLVVDIFGGAAVANGILAAVTDNGVQRVITTGLKSPPFPTRITATAGGTAGDIKAVVVIIGGVDPAGAAITESLPAFTVDTAGIVTGVKVFKEVNSVTIPAHDGIGATTAIGFTGAPKVATAAGIHAAVTDTGVQQVVTTAIIQPDVPRNITATAGGTAGDIKAITVTIAGTNAENVAISEVLPAFTVDTAGIVAGAKAFKTVSSITIPAHDGIGATTAIGFGDILGLSQRRKHKTVMASYLAEVLETTPATELFDAAALEGNTVDLNSALNSTQVKVEYRTTH